MSRAELGGVDRHHMDLEETGLRQPLAPDRRALVEQTIREIGLEKIGEHFSQPELDAYFSDPNAYDGTNDAA
jgi:hypothetical protein